MSSIHLPYDFQALQHDPEAVLSTLKPDQIGEILDITADAYYNKGSPLMSDDLYDLIVDYLKKKDPDHPAIQRIGAPIATGDKVQLPYWMGSLDKIRDDPKALTKWVSEYTAPKEYLISDKLDGNSGMLYYTRQGISLYSRGDGNMGQNVSQLIKHINGVVPLETLLKNKNKNISLPFAVRGELIISRKNWEKIKDLGANARNVVAGAMHSKNPDTRIASKIDFVAYDLLEPHLSPSDGLNLLTTLGFKVVDFKTHPVDHMTMDKLSEILVSRRKDSPYEVDGIVVYHNKQHKRIKGKNPKFAFAFKSLLTHDEAEVIVTKVEWNVSKDGYIKPLVHFPMVVIEGAKISKATGFNASFIEQNKIGPGSRIIVIRSGAVIPHIIRVVSPASNGKPAMPVIPYTWTDTHVDIMIQQQKGEDAINPEMRMKQMEYFANTLDIKHVGPGTIKKLFDAGINSIPKLLALKKDDILKIEGFQSTSAKNVADALATIKNTKCVDLMAASGIFGRGIGARKLAPVLEAYPNLVEMKAPIPSYEELRVIQGMGDVSVKAILEGIIPFRKFIQEIDVPCNVKAKPKDTLTQSQKATTVETTTTKISNMIGMSAVFTGFRNKDWEDKVTSAGGKILTAVSKNTTIVVASDVDEDSSKLKKARELNIPIMSKDEFSSKYHL